MSIGKWAKSVVRPTMNLLASPAGGIIIGALASNVVESARPVLQANGLDAAVSLAPGAYQLDVAGRGFGQVTVHWRPPSPLIAAPAQVIPAADMFDNLMASAAMNNAANAAQPAQPQPGPQQSAQGQTVGPQQPTTAQPTGSTTP